jgi:imidazolonepropionase-like amidohydrolase
MRLRLLAAALLVAAPSQVQAQVKVFTGATLIDGTPRPAITNATIVVNNGRIVTAGPADAIRVPDGSERIALDGKYVVPGLINTHGHINASYDLATYAAYGVTTVFSLGDVPDPVFALRDEQDVATLDRARVYIASPAIAPFTPDSGVAAVRQAAGKKIDLVKIRVDDNLGTTRKATPAGYRAAIQEAHRRNLRVAAHLFYLNDARGLLNANVDVMAHSIRDLAVPKTFADAIAAKGVCYIPTLMREVSTFVYESTPAWFSDSLFLAHANREWLEALSQPARQESFRTSTSAQRYKAALEMAKKNLKALTDAGVLVAMGTDTGPMGRFQGYFELMELELMAQSGLTPREVLRSATRDAARCMKVDRDLGTLEPGKWADMLVLDADPLADISNTRRISSVWIAGNKVAR